MFNLGLGNQSRGGSLLDNVLQLVIPAFSVMRNTQGLFDPEHREGTMTGWGMNQMEQPGGLFGSNQPQGDGLLGSSDAGGYGYDTYDYGNGEIGVESTAYDGMSQSDIDDYGDQVSEF